MKNLFTVSFLFLNITLCVSQGPIITPLRSNAALYNTKAVHSLKRAAGDTIKLPFFDDFTVAGPYPDPIRWADNKVYVNSHFAVSPPSFGVATFDNLNAKGRPYQPLSGNTAGASDSLTCKPLNLKNFINGVNTIDYTLADSIYLSFFYQPMGLGDILDGTDSLVLKFKDTGGNWNTVWKTTGSSVRPFKQILVGILNVKYLYNGFQFSFINYTKNTGNMNQWHLDYVRMKAGRSAKDTAVADVAMNAIPYGPLKYYETLPYNHFKANPLFNLTDNNYAFMRNNNGIDINVNFAFQAKNQYGKIVLDIPFTASARNIFKLSDSSESFPQLKLDTLSSKQPWVTFKYSVIPNALSSDNLQNIYNGNNANNDYTKTLQFRNYYAYDDGSAEGGYSLDYAALPAGPGYTAMKFQTFASDTLRGISIFFNRSVVDVSSRTFDLMVWKNISEPPANNMNNDVLLRKLTIQNPTYLDTINGFVDYVFDTAVALPQGTFYIGWKQVQPFLLNVGYDNNYKYLRQKDYRNPNLFFNLLGYWEKVSASITGTPMMRPIMGDRVKTNLPGSVKGITQSKIGIFPNPSNGTSFLNIVSKTPVITLHMMDMTGKEVMALQGESIESINISGLASGLYTIVLQDSNHHFYNQKYIITE